MKSKRNGHTVGGWGRGATGSTGYHHPKLSPTEKLKKKFIPKSANQIVQEVIDEQMNLIIDNRILSNNPIPNSTEKSKKTFYGSTDPLIKKLWNNYISENSEKTKKVSQ